MKKQKRETVLYVVQQESGFVKIGISTDVALRVTTLEQNSGQHVDVLGVYTIQDWETHLHALCGEQRTIGEWFTADALRVLLPILPQGTEKRGRPFMATCTVCQKPFACKSTRPRRVCRSELCRRKQAAEVGSMVARERPHRGGGRPPKPMIVSTCAVCRTEIHSKRRRTVCSDPVCIVRYNEQQGKALSRSGTLCSVSDCTKISTCKGLCSMHLYRLRVHGSTDDSVVRPYRRQAS